MSDMAPKASGNKELDHYNIIKLCFSVLKFSLAVLKPGGHLLVKLWQGAEQQQLQDICGQHFVKTNFVKPPASREQSAEVFLLAKDFKETRMLT